MKTIIYGIGVAGLLAALAASAQVNFASLDTSSLQYIPRDQLPRFGTFWVEESTGFTAPLPCPPGDLPDAPIYALPDGQFLVDARNCVHVALASPLMMAPGPGGPYGPSPLDVSSNMWFSQIVVQDHS